MARRKTIAEKRLDKQVDDQMAILEDKERQVEIARAVLDHLRRARDAVVEALDMPDEPEQ